jgi:hypothetical protein
MTYDRRLVPGILADLCSEYGLFVSLVGDVGGLQFMVKRSRQPLNVVEDGGYVCDVVLYPVCGVVMVGRRALLGSSRLVGVVSFALGDPGCLEKVREAVEGCL